VFTCQKQQGKVERGLGTALKRGCSESREDRGCPATKEESLPQSARKQPQKRNGQEAKREINVGVVGDDFDVTHSVRKCASVTVYCDDSNGCLGGRGKAEKKPSLDATTVSHEAAVAVLRRRRPITLLLASFCPRRQIRVSYLKAASIAVAA
jgi:hypothetical protein